MSSEMLNTLREETFAISRFLAKFAKVCSREIFVIYKSRKLFSRKNKSFRLAKVKKSKVYKKTKSQSSWTRARKPMKLICLSMLKPLHAGITDAIFLGSKPPIDQFHDIERQIGYLRVEADDEGDESDWEFDNRNAFDAFEENMD